MVGDYFPSASDDAGRPSLPEGGIRVPEGGIRLPEGGLSFVQACRSCHGLTTPDAPGVVIDGDYTPQQTAGLSDEELIRIFAEGEKPEGASYRIPSGNGRTSDEMASANFRRFHTFSTSPEASRALVAYLRQLAPKSRGELDFGGLYPGRPSSAVTGESARRCCRTDRRRR